MKDPEKFWDNLAKKFDKRVKHFEQPPVEKTKQYLNESDVVLDYGCATGTISYEIAGCVKNLLGIDLSSKMIEAAKKKSGDYKIDNIDFEQSTLFDERLKRNSFDVILAFNVLHFLKNTQAVFQRSRELLKPGGVIISATACMGERTFLNFLQFLLFTPLMKLKLIPYMKFLKISELEAALKDEKFEVVEIKMNRSSNYFIVARRS